MTGFVGVNPDGLVGLADTADQYAVRLELMRNCVSALLDRSIPYAGSGVGAALAAAGRTLVDKAGELRWRARVIADAQAAGVSGTAPLTSRRWLAEFAALAVFSPETRAESFAIWRAEAWLIEIRQMTPDAVASAFAEIAPEIAWSMALLHPDLIGDLDGVPAELRYCANRVLIEREIERLEVIVEKVRLNGNGREGVVAGRILERISEYRSWVGEHRRFLLFDPRGDGRIIEVFGDLDEADRVAVVLPGMANDSTNFDSGPGSLRMNAARLYKATGCGGVATIAWLGYDTPDGVDATCRAAADLGAPALTRFLEGLDPFEQRSVTVVAHSYGSVVAGTAAANGIEADNLVFVGSPGTTLDHAGDAVLREEGRVWAGLASGDPIGLGIDPMARFRWWHGLHPFLPAIYLASSLVARDDLWHGVNPVADEFGAMRIATDGSSGHSSYFEAETLENLALILEGRYSDVGLAD